MDLLRAKQELIRRYKYLYENATFILAPFMREQTEEEYENYLKDLKENGWNEHEISEFAKEKDIYLNIDIYDIINSLFEEFLLSDKKMEKSSLYQMIESKKNDKDYLEKVKQGLLLLEKDNKDEEYFKTELDIWTILSKVSSYIEEQSGDLKNKNKKLRVIDEYYRILRYQNNGEIYTSGRKLTLHDCKCLSVCMTETKPSRDKKDIGITKNNFITTITDAPYHEDNRSIFTEKEKQQVYLEYHDELPCDFEINCKLEKDNYLERPEHTTFCGENFILKEEEIFVTMNETSHRYYQLCPHCGFIVNVPEDILSEGIKKRIEERCSKDEKLFRKMYLYSELFGLDNNSTKEQKRMLKK